MIFEGKAVHQENSQTAANRQPIESPRQVLLEAGLAWGSHNNLLQPAKNAGQNQIHKLLKRPDCLQTNMQRPSCFRQQPTLR